MSSDTTTRRPESFIELMDRWETLTALGKDCGVKLVVVQQWKIRDNIPSPYWERVLKSAAKRGIDCDLELLAKLAARKAPPMEGTDNGAHSEEGSGH